MNAYAITKHWVILLVALGLATAIVASRAATLHITATPNADVFDTMQNNVWYLPTADGQANLYLTSFGHGPSIIVLHGGPGNDFNYLIDALRPLTGQYQFVLFDQRGSLLSPVAGDKISGLTMMDLVNDIETLRKALGEEKIVLFAHSFGTLLAEFYFQAHPDHVAGLILAGAIQPSTAPGNFDDLVHAIHKRQDALRARPAVAAALRTAGLAAEQSAKLTPQQATRRFKINNAAIDFYHVDRWREFQGGGVYYNPKVDDAIGNSLPNGYDILPTLRTHSIPVSIIQGDHDYADPAASLWASDTKGMRNVRIYVIRDAGHYSWVDDPAAFKRDMEHALSHISNKD